MSKKYEGSVTDEALIEAALAQPESERARKAASELLGRYGQRVYQWCFRYAGDHEGAMDMAQESLIRAHQKLGSFGGRSRFSSWLFAVTRSVCLNAVHRIEFTRDADAELDIDGVADKSPRPDEAYEALDDRNRMMRFIENVLDPDEQEAIVLRYFEYMTPDEITRIMGLESKSGARGLLQRARRKLVNAVHKQAS